MFNFLKWLIIIATFPIWGPVAFLIAMVLIVGIPMLVQALIIFAGVGGLYLFIVIMSLL